MPMKSKTRPLEGQVAVVAGATRGAGRGIARMLGEAGAVVYLSTTEANWRDGAKKEGSKAEKQQGRNSTFEPSYLALQPSCPSALNSCPSAFLPSCLPVFLSSCLAMITGVSRPRA